MIKYILKIACAGLMFSCLLFCSCNNEGFTLGGNLADSHTAIGIIDTVTIRVSNLVESDSVVTSGTGTAFSGRYTDPYIGTIQTNVYLEFNDVSDYELNYETDKFAWFDSITLVMRPNGNYYGDTTKYASFRIAKLVDQIKKRDDGRLYSSSTMPIGEQLTDTIIQVKVGTKKNKDFEITLPKSFGEWLFKGSLNNEDAFNSSNFLKTFPGLFIGAGTASDCIHGLAITDSTCMLRIYYHVNSTNRENKTVNFKVNQGNSFYHLDNDKSELPPYNSKSDPMPSSKTGDGIGVIMSGAPMYARLEFPHLNELFSLGQIVRIQNATLYVRPVHYSFNTVPLPPKLNIYYFDPTSNTPLSSAIRLPGSDQNAGAQDGGLPEGYQYIQKPYFPQYSFNVTDFISSQLGAVGYNKWALCLVIPQDSRENTLQRMVFGDQKFWFLSDNQSRDNRIRLEITYVAYNE